MTDDVLSGAQERLELRRAAARANGKPLVPLASSIPRVVRAAPVPPESDEERETRIAGQVERVRANARAAIARWLVDAGVPKRYRVELDERLVPPELRAWAGHLPEFLREGGGALLVGSKGTGKTAGACWLIQQAYLRAPIGVPENGEPEFLPPRCAFVAAADVIDAVIEKRRDWLTRAATVDLLVIDDWGVGYEGSAWGVAGLDRLVDRRWSELKPTVVTTNMLPEAEKGEESFAARYPRAFDRLVDRAGPGVIEVLCKSLRRKP